VHRLVADHAQGLQHGQQLVAARRGFQRQRQQAVDQRIDQRRGLFRRGSRCGAGARRQLVVAGRLAGLVVGAEPAATALSAGSSSCLATGQAGRAAVEREAGFLARAGSSPLRISTSSWSVERPVPRSCLALYSWILLYVKTPATNTPAAAIKLS
jgi:hypothetical protein